MSEQWVLFLDLRGCFSFALGSFLKQLIVSITARSIWLSSYQLLGFFKMTINVSLATKFETENINGKIDFNLWHNKMCAFLIQQGLLKALKGKDVLPATLSDEEKRNLLQWAHRRTPQQNRVAKFMKKILWETACWDRQVSKLFISQKNHIEKKVHECSSM